MEVKNRNHQQIQNREKQQPGNGNYRASSNGDSKAGVMASHFQLMQSFLQTQESVMRAFLNSGGRNGATTATGGFGQHAYAVETVEAVELEPVDAEIVAPKPVPSLAPAVQPNGNGNARTEAIAPAPASVVPVVTSLPVVDIQEALLKVVSDRTGYPVEMLGLDLDMEADLGIDSIKRIEILSALQQMGGREELASESTMEEVARLKTLRQVLDFFRARSGQGV